MPFYLKIAFFCLMFLPAAAPADDFAAKVFTDKDGKTMPYRLLIPALYDSATKYPVILFFHGSGERGVDNLAELRHGVAPMTTPALRLKYPAFVIVPQCPVKQGWVNMNWNNLAGTRPAHPSDSEQMALKILDSVTAQYSTDKDRFFVMGLSMGGFAVWDCITRFPDKFAAGVAVCGGGDEATVTAEVAKVPVWAFGSSDDPVVKPIRSLHMVGAMLEKGGHPRYYLYTGLGHGSWDKAFSEPELLPWVFKQTRAQAPVVPATTTVPPAALSVTPQSAPAQTAVPPAPVTEPPQPAPATAPVQTSPTPQPAQTQ